MNLFDFGVLFHGFWISVHIYCRTSPKSVHNVTLSWPYLQWMMRNRILLFPMHCHHLYRTLLHVLFSSSDFIDICIDTVCFYDFAAFVGSRYGHNSVILMKRRVYGFSRCTIHVYVLHLQCTRKKPRRKLGIQYGRHGSHVGIRFRSFSSLPFRFLHNYMAFARGQHFGSICHDLRCSCYCLQ
jgi:hypothetical protein